MSIFVYFPDHAECEALCAKLKMWMELSCVSTELVCDRAADQLPPSSIVFWDLDASSPPPYLQTQEYTLFLCSCDPQRAIDSYTFHPTGFLTKPISMDKLWHVMLRCSSLWFPDLLRLEIVSERVRVGIPYQNLLWAEGTRRGCMLHTTHQSIPSREPLYRLEQRLPERIFIRCQRSFLVNLLHVHQLTGNYLYLSDGTQVSLGRGNKAEVRELYRQFCLLRYERPEPFAEGGAEL